MVCLKRDNPLITEGLPDTVVSLKQIRRAVLRLRVKVVEINVLDINDRPNLSVVGLNIFKSLSDCFLFRHAVSPSARSNKAKVMPVMRQLRSAYGKPRIGVDTGFPPFSKIYTNALFLSASLNTLRHRLVLRRSWS